MQSLSPSHHAHMVLSSSISLKRALRRSAATDGSDRAIGEAAAHLYKLLWEGEYMDFAGRRQKVNGDISKVSRIIGLSATQQALLQNYFFMSSRIPGTRQIRSSIRHLIFSSRIFYGIPVFVTWTPSERHSGLVVRLVRGRRTDPGFLGSASVFAPWIGHAEPSLCPSERASQEAAMVSVEEDTATG